ncbi:hypothetical protein NC653_040449 [Populus alba x Populus x berolinensis]|uniref:Uncharacterized protein n=1 Tax=Populus alba x Populus x berolinensis TaxID=444605 RepID=A0AAD6L793_9ROSI|nr:hypothetical protein NC653_040449 [Populus alba x Populus x berolinensis]
MALLAGKEGNVILMFTSNQRSAIRSLERVAWCKFEFVNPPAIEEVLESSAGQMVATLDGAQPESSQFFRPICPEIDRRTTKKCSSY